jgi:hypothetical protein
MLPDYPKIARRMMAQFSPMAGLRNGFSLVRRPHFAPGELDREGVRVTVDQRACRGAQSLRVSFSLENNQR